MMSKAEKWNAGRLGSYDLPKTRDRMNRRVALAGTGEEPLDGIANLSFMIPDDSGSAGFRRCDRFALYWG